MERSVLLTWKLLQIQIVSSPANAPQIPTPLFSHIDIFHGAAKMKTSSWRIRALGRSPGNAACPKCETHHSERDSVAKKLLKQNILCLKTEQGLRRSFNPLIILPESIQSWHILKCYCKEQMMFIFTKQIRWPIFAYVSGYKYTASPKLLCFIA